MADEMKKVTLVVLKRMVVMHDDHALRLFVNAVDDQVAAGGDAMIAQLAKKDVFAKGELVRHGL